MLGIEPRRLRTHFTTELHSQPFVFSLEPASLILKSPAGIHEPLPLGTAGCWVCQLQSLPVPSGHHPSLQHRGRSLRATPMCPAARALLAQRVWYPRLLSMNLHGAFLGSLYSLYTRVLHLETGLHQSHSSPLCCSLALQGPRALHAQPEPNAAETTGSDKPGTETRKGHFKAHKITENRTAQEAFWLLPKLCRFVQMLCKSTMRRWQGALADSQAREPSHQSASASASSREGRSCYPTITVGTGSAPPLILPMPPPCGLLPLISAPCPRLPTQRTINSWLCLVPGSNHPSLLYR